MLKTHHSIRRQLEGRIGKGRIYMQKRDLRKWPVMLVASLMIVGAFFAAITPTVQAGGGFIPLLKQAPIGYYQFELSFQENIGPEALQTMPIIGLSNTAEIQNYAGPGGHVIIPTIVQYPFLNVNGEIVVEDPPLSNVVRVASIAAEAFKGRVDILSITIPEGVEYIGASAFSGCTNLTSLYFLGSNLPSNLSEQWLLGANIGLKGYANHVAGISPLGTEFHGLMIYRLSQVTPMKPPAPLTGSIVDSNGQSVVGAVVMVGNDSNTTTDENGHFILMAPVGLNSVTISGANVKTTTVATYLGASGTEMGTVPVVLAGNSKSYAIEGVALMIAVIGIAMALLMVSMLVARKRLRE